MEFITVNSSNVGKMRPKLAKNQCFIKFWMDGCGHCVQMAPEWEAMKQQLSKEYVSPRGETAIVEIDAPASAQIPLGRQISGFPTIMHASNGHLVETYSGPRTAEAMKTWIIANARDLEHKSATHKTRKRRRRTKGRKRGRSRLRKQRRSRRQRRSGGRRR
jgi:thioredoxin-like negative regulator of GroEL